MKQLVWTIVLLAFLVAPSASESTTQTPNATTLRPCKNNPGHGVCKNPRSEPALFKRHDVEAAAPQKCLEHWENPPETPFIIHNVKVDIGTRLRLRGTPQRDMTDKNILVQFRGLNDSENYILFQFNAKFANWLSLTGENVIERNSKFGDNFSVPETNGSWPFARGTEFVLQFLIEEKEFIVSVDGAYLLSYQHRANYTTIDTIRIMEDVNIAEVELHQIGDNCRRNLKCGNCWREWPIVMDPNESTYNRKASFQAEFRRNFHLIMMATLAPRKFTSAKIGLYGQSNKTSPMTMQMRWDKMVLFNREYANGATSYYRDYQKVRNSTWPFEFGKQFELEIMIGRRGFQVMVDGWHYGTFEFSDDSPYRMRGYVNVEGDITVQRLTVLDTYGVQLMQ